MDFYLGGGRNIRERRGFSAIVEKVIGSAGLPRFVLSLLPQTSFALPGVPSSDSASLQIFPHLGLPIIWASFALQRSVRGHPFTPFATSLSCFYFLYSF